jgi:hypothetical protein
VTALRRGRSSRTVEMSAAVSAWLDRGEGRAARTSARRADWISGCSARRWVAHVKALDVVSCLGVR